MKHLLFTLRLLPAVLALLAIAAPAGAQTNLLTNPGFEASGGSYDGWDVFGEGPQISTPGTDNIARTGSAAAKIYGEFSNCPTPVFDVGGFYQAFTPVAGMEYELRGYTFISSDDPIPGGETCNRNRLIAKIVFFNGAAEVSSNELIIGNADTPLDEWIEFSLSAPAPSTATNVQAMFLFLQPGCDTGSVFVDDASFTMAAPAAEPSVLVNGSFDGGLTGWTTFGNVFYDARSWAARTPQGGAKMFSTFVEGSDSGLYQVFPATPDGIWKLDLYAMTTCVESPITGLNDNFVLARIVFFDSGGTEIDASEEVVLDAGADLGTWTKHTLVGVAPAGTDSVGAYLLFISPSLLNGAAWFDDLTFQEWSYVGVPPAPEAAGIALHPNVPNPFNPATRISFDLDRKGEVALEVYDVTGRLVTTLFDGEADAGPHTVTWDGTMRDGRPAASGIYWSVLRTESERASRRMVLVK